MHFVKTAMDCLSRNILKVIFSIIFVFALFIKAMYCFDDSPYFTSNTLYDLLIGLLCVTLFLIIVKFRSLIQTRLNYHLCFFVFMVTSIIYIILVPLKPFSDMEAIYNGALHISRFEFKELLFDNYWKVFPGNIILATFWGILLIPFPKSLITIKIINALTIYLIAAITRNIAKELKIKSYNLVYLFTLTFSPLFLYINHVYFDLPVIVICMLAIYLFVKNKNIILIFTLLGIAKYIRSSASIVMFAMVFVYVFNVIAKKDAAFNKIKSLIGAIIVFFILGSMLPSTVFKLYYGNEPVKSYSGWNQFYIGINETEFGFMDNDFSYDRDLNDILERVHEYGSAKMCKIIVKKTFWLWSQGTYQAERYAFGADTSDKFQYNTFLTKYLMNSSQTLRKIINSFMRSQYLILFLLMIITFWKEKDISTYRLFYYIIFGTFTIMLVYELKSRYILQLAPMMIIFSVRCIDDISQQAVLKIAQHN